MLRVLKPGLGSILLKLTFDQHRHVLEKSDLLQAEMARSNVQHAQGAHTASAHEQRASGIEARPRPSANLWIVGKAVVGESIGHQEQLASRNGMRAK